MKAVEKDAAALQDHITRTYLDLRIGVAVIGAALPLLLWIGGGLGNLRPSMSDYYYSVAMRDTFVGSLVAIGFFLYLYKGFSTLENWALNLAGVLAVGVAMVPTTEGKTNFQADLHTVFAVVFFLAIAYVCIFRASDTLSLIQDTRRGERLRTVYRLLGIGMVISPLLALVLSRVLERPSALIFLVEAVGVWMFSSFWLVKSFELRETNAEELAMQGKLQAIEPAPAVAPGRLIQVEP